MPLASESRSTDWDPKYRLDGAVGCFSIGPASGMNAFERMATKSGSSASGPRRTQTGQSAPGPTAEFKRVLNWRRSSGKRYSLVRGAKCGTSNIQGCETLYLLR